MYNDDSLVEPYRSQDVLTSFPPRPQHFLTSADDKWRIKRKTGRDGTGEEWRGKNYYSRQVSVSGERNGRRKNWEGKASERL